MFPTGPKLVKYRGKYAAYFRTGGQPRRVSLGTSDLAEARRRLRDELTPVIAGDTIRETLTAYLEDKQGAHGHEGMRFAWKALEPHWGDLTPRHVTRAECRSYARLRRSQGVGDGTIIKELGMLRAGLRWAKKDGPCMWDFPPTPEPRDRHLTREEWARLLDACRVPHLKLFAILAMNTGARASALLELRWDRVDFQRGKVNLRVPGEGRKGRAVVPMTDTARAALEEAWRGRQTEFVIEWAGRPIRSVKTAFRNACQRAKLENVSPHVLRHSAAVWMIEDGQPIEAVAQFLGHSDTRVTYRVYARHSPEHLKKVASVFDRADAR